MAGLLAVAKRRWRLLGAVLLFELSLLLFIVGWILPSWPVAPNSDLAAIWAAGAEILSGGQAAALYDGQYFAQALKDTAAANARLLWHYPPFFLPLAALVAMVPLALAYWLWVAISSLACMACGRIMALSWPQSFLFLAFPASLNNALKGQTSGLVLLAFTGGLVLMERRPYLAGAIFGLAAFKPHLAMAVPFALLFARRWRALAGFIASVAGLTLGSLAIYGPQAWAAFLRALLDGGEQLAAGVWGFELQISAYGLFRRLSIDHDWALMLHMIYAAGWLALLAWHWARPSPPACRAAILALTALTISPYALPHDLVLLAIPAALALRGIAGGAPWTALASLFVLFWLYHCLFLFTSAPWPPVLVLAGILWSLGAADRNKRAAII